MTRIPNATTFSECLRIPSPKQCSPAYDDMISMIELLKYLLKTDTDPCLMKFPSEKQTHERKKEASIARGILYLKSPPWSIWI